MSVVHDNIIKSSEIFDPYSDKQSVDKNDQKILSFGVSSFGYDLRLSAKEFFIFTDSDSDKQETIDPKKFNKKIGTFEKCLKDDSGEFFILPPQSYALGVSVEHITMPDNFIGICLGKSSYARSGLIINCTPLEPGWNGYLTIEMYNTTSKPMKIYANEGILQVIMFMGCVPDISYIGKYQDQLDKITFPI